MWRALSCVSVVLVSVISLSRAQPETNNAPSCATYATVSFPRTLHCPSSSEDGVSVTWCLTCPFGGGKCFNSTSVTSSIGCGSSTYVNGSLKIPQYSGTFSFVDNVSLYISYIDLTYGSQSTPTVFNCTCQYSNGSTCGGKRNFTLNVDNPGLISFYTPIADKPVLSYNVPPYGSMMYGTRVAFCISGSSNGYTNVSWIKDSSYSIAVQDVTANITCSVLNCQSSCVQNFIQLYATPTEHYTGFMIMPYTSPCSQAKLAFVSVLFIDSVSIGDEGIYSFSIVSYNGFAIKAQNSIGFSPFYGNVAPIYDCTGGTTCPQSGSNAIFRCNVSLTYNTSVQWYHKPSNAAAPALVPIPYKSWAGPVGELQLSRLCSDPDLMGSTFALLLGQTPVPRPPQGVTATLYLSAVVVCGVTDSSYGYYYGATGSTQGPGCTLSLPSPLPGANVTTTTTSTVFGVVMGVVFLVVLGVAAVFIRQYWVKRTAVNIMAPVALQMRPLLLHQTSSLQSPDETGLLRELQAPRDTWEFPRTNLEFVALLGEGQFGQVWKAQATGICADEGRNIVAVKTVKPHASPADIDELYAELEIMKHIEPNPNILNLLGQCSQTDTQPLCILMEFACYGSLKDYLQRCGELVRQRSSAKVFTASSDTLTPPTIPLSTHVCSYHQQVLGHLNHYLAQGAGGRGSWQDYLPMASVREENQYQVGGALQRKDTSPCQPHPQEGGVVTCQHVEQAPPLCQEAWQVSATNRLATPDPGQEAGSNRSSYVYPQEQLSSERGTSPSGCPAGGQQQQQLSQQGTSLGGLGVQQMLENRASPGCQTEGQRGASPGYQAGGQRGVSPECQAGGQRGISPECQAGGQRGISPGYQAGGQRGISPGYQAGGQRGISPGYQAGGQRGISPGYQAGGQQLTVPQDPRIVQRSETPLSCPPSMDCMYCSQADHYRNLGKGEGSSLEAKVGEVAEAVELMTSDILNFALQIVRGMEHLENMKYVHRDLAARNVLIAEGFLLKVGDFGLTRDLSEREYYKKITAGKLPARWMAIESLQSRKHTYKSDVWSFGVVLWEMFTYGAVPYGRLPAANSCESLANYLKRGERLAQPPNCSDDLYQLMLRCWNENVEQRPSFSDLKRIFDDLLSSTHGYLRMVSDNVDESRPAVHEAHTEGVASHCEPLQSHAPIVLSIDPEPPIKCPPISTLSPVNEGCSPQQGDRSYLVTRPLVQSHSLDFKETVM